MCHRYYSSSGYHGLHRQNNSQENSGAVFAVCRFLWDALLSFPGNYIVIGHGFATLVGRLLVSLGVYLEVAKSYTMHGPCQLWPCMVLWDMELQEKGMYPTMSESSQASGHTIPLGSKIYMQASEDNLDTSQDGLRGGTYKACQASGYIQDDSYFRVSCRLLIFGSHFSRKCLFISSRASSQENPAWSYSNYVPDTRYLDGGTRCRVRGTMFQLVRGISFLKLKFLSCLVPGTRHQSSGTSYQGPNRLTEIIIIRNYTQKPTCVLLLNRSLAYSAVRLGIVLCSAGFAHVGMSLVLKWFGGAMRCTGRTANETCGNASLQRVLASNFWQACSINTTSSGDEATSHRSSILEP